MSKFRMNSTVWISHKSQRKTSGEYNKGKVVGIEAINNGLYFIGTADFFRGFDSFRYKVAYIDVFTGKGRSEWFNEDYLSKTKPEDATN